jgi:predicted AAA+ superfamily ATPase
MEQVLSILDVHDPYFWATHSGAELDLLVTKGGKRVGFEFKYGDAPVKTRSMHSAFQDLKLDRLFIIYPGDQEYEIDDKIAVLSINRISDLKKRIK